MKYINIQGDPVELLFSASKTIENSDFLISGTTCQFYKNQTLTKGFLAHISDRESVIERWNEIKSDFQTMRQVVENLVFYSND
jgi:hypothetical protein